MVKLIKRTSWYSRPIWERAFRIKEHYKTWEMGGLEMWEIGPTFYRHHQALLNLDVCRVIDRGFTRKYKAIWRHL